MSAVAPKKATPEGVFTPPGEHTGGESLTGFEGVLNSLYASASGTAAGYGIAAPARRLDVPRAEASTAALVGALMEVIGRILGGAPGRAEAYEALALSVGGRAAALREAADEERYRRYYERGESEAVVDAFLGVLRAVPPAGPEGRTPYTEEELGRA